MVLIIGNAVLTTPPIPNLKNIIYRWVPDTYTPQTVMGQILPTGFRLPHKWVTGEVHILSEAKSQMDNYVKAGLENIPLTMVATQKDAEGGTWTYTFTGCLFLNEYLAMSDNEEIIIVYPFVAKKVDISNA